MAFHGRVTKAAPEATMALAGMEEGWNQSLDRCDSCITRWGPEGTDYKNHIVYIEVVRPQRLVYQHPCGWCSPLRPLVSTSSRDTAPKREGSNTSHG